MESGSADNNRRLYSKEELEGLVNTLRNLFNPKFKKEEGFLPYEKEILNANPFLTEIFEALDKKENWENILDSPPGRIEVTMLPITNRDRNFLLTTPSKLLMFHLNREEREYFSAPGKILTLFVSLPKGCIQANDADKKLLWGAEMPCKFYFAESRKGLTEGIPQFELLHIAYPFR